MDTYTKVNQLFARANEISEKEGDLTKAEEREFYRTLYLRRSSDGDVSDGDSRLAGLFQYDLNDEMSLFLSVGENFETNLAPLLSNEDVVAILGFKMSGGSAVSLKSFQ